MKPLKLVMSAFGSYAGQEVLDFENIQQGIFLITGDTGAGKTTIFDGITYALYDETSGGCRDGNMMRSQYAADETETFVEFTFLYRDEIYTVRRNPEYMRPGKRRNADGSPRVVKELNKVELTLPDGTAFMGRKRETDQKIAEIIGLDADQFRQVAMIAQGDFLKLLHAESRERKIIFSKIFHTKIYWRIQELLKTKAKELYGRLEDTRKLCQREVDSVQCVQDSEFREAWKACAENAEFSLDEAVQVLEQIVREGEDKNREIERARKEIAGKIELLGELLRSEETVRSSERKLISNQKSIEVLKAWLNEQEKVFEKLQTEQKAAEDTLREREPVLTANITRLEDSLKKYQQLERQQAECKKQQKELIRLDKELEKAEKEIQRREKKKEALDISLGKLEDVQARKVESENRLHQMQERQEAVRKLLKQVVALRKMENMQEKARAGYEVAQQEARTAADTYDKLYQQFFIEQAGILADKLEEGAPCPVCGSCEHPHKMPLSKEAPTQEQVENAKNIREQVEKSREKAYLAFCQAKQKRETQWETAVLAGRELLGLKTFSPDESGRIRVEKELENVEKQLDKAADDVDKVRQQIQKKEEQQEELKLLLTDQEKQIKFLKELEREKQQAVLQTGTLEREIVLIQKELPYSNAKEARQELRKQQMELDGFRKAANLLAQEYQKQVKAQSLKTGEKKAQEDQQIQLNKELEKARRVQERQRKSYMETAAKTGISQEDLPTLYPETLRDNLQEMQRESRVLEKVYIQSYAVNKKNEEALDKLERHRQEQTQMRRDYTLYNDLSKTANGNLSGSIKMDFETYVQRQYFKQIISAANKRLVLMNNQQFILQCREMERLGTQGQVGLDLDVYHLVNDSSRDVKTLSGGESFMAALSMALGLADIIQNEAGAIRLDTMFVDEGFGSLDDEARAQAIQVLLELADDQRLVGIISHVNELKEQIDNKLLVTKDDKGSHVQWK